MHIGIAVQSRTIPEQEQQEYLQALLASMLAVATQHTFAIITDDTALVTPLQLNTLQTPSITSYFGLRRWYGKTLPALLKKEKLEALITINVGMADISIPQIPVFIAPSAALLARKTWLRFLYKRYLAKRLQKAIAIGIITNLQVPEIQKLYRVKEDQLFATGYAVPATYQPIADWQQREVFLQKQTGGREYFLYTGSFSEERFLHLLKAFSLFKKRQQSNMQLLVPVDFAIDKKLQEKLNSYKYRQDVQFIPNPDRSILPRLMACAYAVLFMKKNTSTAYPIAIAIQCQVPVIGLEKNDALKEVAGEAALYAEASVESLAEQMKLIYKDETIRQSLIFHSQQKAPQVSGREASLKILTQLSMM